mmetsp:Transcript_17523/g.45826  ORF Transcript_17523/g.45826 Transcript_17523/m.45826 type:complete len:107 (-) Transcript_17523:8-328(-)
MPLWQVHEPRSIAKQPTITEKSPLLSHSINANGPATDTRGPESEPRKDPVSPLPDSPTTENRVTTTKHFFPGFSCNKCKEPDSAEWNFVKGRPGLCSKCVSESTTS